ncbi:unnamed protein product [Anisakis simplex]|uniref:Putative acid phosphatase 5 (inferred by orthology to a C. elegans protein) n=1 Tax=Anisakis simplex TaxID=6269 RepID=A0A0M3KH71_ANISI|nr:unnamed protein product [Anisakis simplex]
MSAQANLAAMFKPPANQVLANDLRWLPIPVHTVAKESDPELYESIECPAANKKVTQMYAQNKEIVALEKKNAVLLNYIAKNAHWPNGTLSLSEMWFIFDPLNVVFHHNDTHKMPKWVNSTIWNEIVRLYDQTCQFYFSTDKVKRLRAGMLLKDIIGRLKRKSHNPVTEREKFYAYSAVSSFSFACTSSKTSAQ